MVASLLLPPPCWRMAVVSQAILAIATEHHYGGAAVGRSDRGVRPGLRLQAVSRWQTMPSPLLAMSR